MNGWLLMFVEYFFVFLLFVGDFEVVIVSCVGYGFSEYCLDELGDEDHVVLQVVVVFGDEFFVVYGDDFGGSVFLCFVLYCLVVVLHVCEWFEDLHVFDFMFVECEYVDGINRWCEDECGYGYV